MILYCLFIVFYKFDIYNIGIRKADGYFEEVENNR